MSKTVFSSALFEQMGGVNWSARPGSVEFYPHNNDVAESMSEQVVDGLTGELSVEESSELYADNAEQLLTTPISSIVQAAAIEPEQEAVNGEAFVSATLLSPENSSNIVVLGAGLDAVWQNDETLAWQLWQNIMRAFDWDEAQMTFFDTSHLVSEEMIFTTMEEVIDLGVDWVLTMDDEHPISEQLVEGVHVVSVPDLESMLSDPYAKQSFYHAVVEVNNPR